MYAAYHEEESYAVQISSSMSYTIWQQSRPSATILRSTHSAGADHSSVCLASASGFRMVFVSTCAEGSQYNSPHMTIMEFRV